MSTQIRTPDATNAMVHYMNNEQQASLLNFARVLADCGWATNATMITLNTTGFELEACDDQRTQTVRINFPKPAEDDHGLRMALMGLAMQADIPDGIEREAAAQVTTEKAERYLKALCNHFDHKGNAHYVINDQGIGEGHVTFDFGICTMESRANALHLRVRAESIIRFNRIKHVVSDHLVRFANKEDLQVTWVDEGKTE